MDTLTYRGHLTEAYSNLLSSLNAATHTGDKQAVESTKYLLDLCREELRRVDTDLRGA